MYIPRTYRFWPDLKFAPNMDDLDSLSVRAHPNSKTVKCIFRKIFTSCSRIAFLFTLFGQVLILSPLFKDVI